MELYINDTKVDLNERLPFPLNFQVSDIRDLSKRKGSSSNTITIPGTSNNVRLFSGVFVVSATDSLDGNSTGFDNFDPTVKASARYYENGVLQFEGVCQLRDCVKVDGMWRFEVVLFQESIDIVKLLDNYKVRELGWSEYNHTLNKTNQANSWSGSIIKNGASYSNISGTDWIGEGYYYGLIDYGYDRPANDTFRVEDIAPQVFVKSIIDKMFDKIGVTYDSDFFDTQTFKKLLLAYEGGEFPSIGSTVSNANSVQTDWLTDGSGYVLNKTQNLVNPIDPSDNRWSPVGNQYDRTNYVNNTATEAGATGLIQSDNPFQFAVQEPGLYTLEFDGTVQADLDFTVTGGSGSYDVFWQRFARVEIYKNNQIYQQEVIYSNDLFGGASLTNTVSATGTFVFDLELEPSDIIEVKLYTQNNHSIEDTGGTPTAVESQLTISPTIEVDITLEQVSITEGSTVNLRQFLPEKMTCAEFFKGIVSMFNLIVKTNEDNPRQLEIEPLDDFYLGTQDAFGNDITLDWSKLVDRSKEWRVTPTINLATKNYSFMWQDGKDFFNNSYLDTSDEQYGSKIVENSSEFATGNTEQKIPFSQVPVVEVPTTDLIIPRLFQVKTDEGGLSTIEPKRGKAFVCQIYDANAGTLRTGDWVHNDSVGDTNRTEYPYIGHIDDPDKPEFDLLFNVPDYVFYTLTGGQDYTTNNLYTYYEKSIRELIDRNGKLLTCYVKLDSNIINTLDFKRLIKIDGVVYKLNKIENYDSNKNDTTKVELLKVIEGTNVRTYTSVEGKAEKSKIETIKLDGSKIESGTPTKSLGLNDSGEVVQSSKIGSGYASGDIIYVASLSDLPTPSGGRITLADNTLYYFVTNVDLDGNILVGGENTAIRGTSSETASITSTGLGSTTALLTTNYTTPINDITFKDVGTALDIDGTGNNVALDWTSVNFSNVTTIGVVKNVDNFIYSKSAFLDSQGLSFDGTIGTIAINNSLLSGDSTTADDIVRLESTATITRRFRIIYSSVIFSDPTTGINVESGITIDNQSFILDTVNFGGGGSYLQGLDYTSNKALFVNCDGIINSDEIAQYYMNGNTTETIVTDSGVAYKVAGTTTAASFNQKFTHTNNRATYTGTKTRFFKVVANISVEANNNNQIGVYIAKNGTLINESEVYGTTSGSGRAENIVSQTIVEMAENDYIEIFVKNDSSTKNITATELNVIVE